MERLTERYMDVEAYVKRKDVVKLCDRYIGSAIDKLADYEDAEEEGRFVRLLCKPGDTVYLLHEGICKAEIAKVEFKKSAMVGKLYFAEPVGRRGSLYRYCDSDFGVVIFLTREAAEQRKAELERGGVT